MSDIFLNYVLDDLDKAEKLRDTFQQQGWTVFWRNPYLLYKRVDAEIVDKELKGAKVIVTLWSSRAARRMSAVRETLEQMSSALPVFVRLDRRVPPSTFAPIRAFDLSDWDGAASHAGLQKLLNHLRALIFESPLTAKPPASFEELSLSEIQESARLGISGSGVAQPEGGPRFNGIFISYRRDDSAGHAGRLYDRLAAHFGGEKIFMDVDLIEPGEDFVRVIEEAIGSCEILLALIGRSWLTTSDERGRRLDNPHDFVRLELAAALASGAYVIPVLVHGAKMPDQQDLPEDLSPLAGRQAFELSDVRWPRDVEALIRHLEKPPERLRLTRRTFIRPFSGKA